VTDIKVFIQDKISFLREHLIPFLTVLLEAQRVQIKAKEVLVESFEFLNVLDRFDVIFHVTRRDAESTLERWEQIYPLDLAKTLRVVQAPSLLDQVFNVDAKKFLELIALLLLWCLRNLLQLVNFELTFLDHNSGGTFISFHGLLCDREHHDGEPLPAHLSHLERVHLEHICQVISLRGSIRKL